MTSTLTPWGREVGELDDAFRAAAARYPRTCDAPYCRAYVTHWARHRYIPGEGGRATVDGTYLCTSHAEAYAYRHGLTIDAPIQVTTERNAS